MSDDSWVLFFLGVRSAVEGRRREQEPGSPQLCGCPPTFLFLILAQQWSAC